MIVVKDGRDIVVPDYKDNYVNGRALLRITPELLSEALRLRSDIELVNIFQTDDDKMMGAISVTLTGPNLPHKDESYAPPYMSAEDVCG